MAAEIIPTATELPPMTPEQNQRENGDGIKSGPICKNLIRLHDLFWRTGEIEFEFSSPAGDMDLDGIEAAVFHPEAELFVDFSKTVLLEAIAHAQASARAGHIATLIAGCFGRW
jgi:hypothetical protein